MSVVVVTDTYRTIEPVLARLRAQTVRQQLELVIVIPRGSREGEEQAGLDEFGASRIVEVDTVHPMPACRAAGIRAATAPIVFLGETHSFPHPTFAERLLSAHESEWDVVIPGIANANPASAWSWASFLMDYGMWLDRLPGGQIGGGPTWNVAYRTSVLAEFDGGLETAMEHGDELAVWFHARRGRAWFEPAAHLDHANVSLARPWLEQRYLCGVLVANARKRRWGIGKRALYVAASPLIPAVILYRLRAPVAKLLRAGELPGGTLPALVLGTLLRTAGEVVGYVRGARPGAQPRMDHFELHKLAFTDFEVRH
jgi:hypothetical protein